MFDVLALCLYVPHIPIFCETLWFHQRHLFERFLICVDELRLLTTGHHLVYV
jgi:hypothetical protein